MDASSLLSSEKVIDDYAATSGKTRNAASSINHAQPGDPAKLADGVLRLVAAEAPPLRMPFGSDCIARIEAKNAFVAGEIAQWRALAVSTDAAV